MTAYKVADELQECIDDGSTDLMCVQEAVTVIRQQADLIEHYKNKAEYLDKRELELLVKIRKYEEVLHAIANDYHELSNHKIEVQVRNHKKWAREALNED